MKKTRKLISLLMALAMIFALAIPAFAETVTGEGTVEAGNGTGSITITNPVKGETYSAYQMLELSYNETTKSYSYTIAQGWESFFNNSSYFTVDSYGYVTSVYGSNSSEIAAAAKAALAYAKENKIEPVASVTATESASITGLALGYYLVDTSLGTLCSIDSTDTAAEIVEKNDKNDEPDVDKTVNELDNNSAGIGDVLNYSITVSNVSDKSNVKVSDTLSEGLTLNTDSIKVTVNGADVNTEYYTLDTTSTSNGFTITFTDNYLAGMDDDIVITYTAVVNENAVIGVDGNTNKAILSYGNSQSTSDTTKTYVYGIDIFKYTEVDTTVDGETKTEETALPGAKFVLYYKTAEVVDEDTGTTGDVTYYAVVNNGKLTGWTTTENDATKLTSNDEGKIAVNGLAAGTYYLEETEAPTGYNKLVSPIKVVITGTTDGNEELTGQYTVSVDGTTIDGSTVKVLNNAGSELPSTGGMGTTLFYIFGGALVLCAVVLLVTRRRMDNEQ